MNEHIRAELAAKKEEERIRAMQQQDEKQEAEATRIKSTTELLIERGLEYGDFANHAFITQALEQSFFQLMLRFNAERAQKDFTPTMREGVHMIFHKLGRIANGNPKNIDSWDDIAGYAKLVADHIREEKSF